MPADLDEIIDRGRKCYEDRDLAGATVALRDAVTRFPESFSAHYNFGVVLRDLGESHEALSSFGKALLIKPGEPSVYNNLGILHERLEDYPSAFASFRAAISLDPNLAIAHLNLSTLMLRLGHFREGFAEFEWRFRTGQVKPFDCPHPRWDGSRMPGTLLVHTEQGAGDAIQFVRFLPAVAERVGRLLFVCPERLTRLFAQIPAVAEMRNAGTFDVRSFDAYCPLLSLPTALGITLENLPKGTPYLEAPDTVPLPLSPGKAEPRLRVGITWAGSRTHIGDVHRSCMLEDFAPLFRSKDVAFYNLQIGEAEELAASKYEIVDLADLQGDWADAASLVSQLDLVVTVDTGVAHLAAALGVPVWIALSKQADWRWMTKRTDSPWYRSVRLFRQNVPGDWASVFADIANALEAFD